MVAGYEDFSEDDSDSKDNKSNVNKSVDVVDAPIAPALAVNASGLCEGEDLNLTTGGYSSFERMVRAHGRSPTSSYALCSMFSDALGLPQRACLGFPRSREWEVAVGRYRALFAVDPGT